MLADLYNFDAKFTLNPGKNNQRRPKLVWKGVIMGESKKTFKIKLLSNRWITLIKNLIIIEFEHNSKIYKLNGTNIGNILNRKTLLA